MKILIFHTGSLGDTLAIVPALWVLRDYFTGAKITLLSDSQRGIRRITPQDILDKSGIIDEFKLYPSNIEARRLSDKISDGFHLLQSVRAATPDVLVYLTRRYNQDSRIYRDLTFFKLAGVRKIIGMRGFISRPRMFPGIGAQKLPPLVEQYLSRLTLDGIPIPSVEAVRADIHVSPMERARVDQWRQGKYHSGGPWVAFGPGSNMNSKKWPIDRFAEVGKQLIASYNAWPIVLGGREDALIGDDLLARWNRGWVAAGELSVRETAALLERCCLYVGNDTGTMHLAASAGVRCVAIFSARDYPGLWEPYGSGHRVLRVELACQGCMKTDCDNPAHPCLNRIEVSDVTRCCDELLRASTISI